MVKGMLLVVGGLALVAGAVEGAANQPGVMLEQQAIEQELLVEQEAGGMLIGLIIEQAEPYAVWKGEKPMLKEPRPDETHHIEVVLRDASTKRVIPYARVKLIMAKGGVVKVEKALDPLWAEAFFHYGTNAALPEEGHYTITVRVDPPTFGRHEPFTQFTHPVEATFTVEITGEAKRH